MLQRIQTLYLLIVLLITPLVIYFLSGFQTTEILVGMVSVVLIGILTILAIFSYKKRILQIRLNLVNLMINILLIGFFGYVTLTSPGGILPEKGVGLFILALNSMLLLLANRNISKDEKLVKSVDRIR